MLSSKMNNAMPMQKPLMYIINAKIFNIDATVFVLFGSGVLCSFPESDELTFEASFV